LSSFVLSENIGSIAQPPLLSYRSKESLASSPRSGSVEKKKNWSFVSRKFCCDSEQFPFLASSPFFTKRVLIMIYHWQKIHIYIIKKERSNWCAAFSFFFFFYYPKKKKLTSRLGLTARKKGAVARTWTLKWGYLDSALQIWKNKENVFFLL
jgi:hypothetical protein